MLFYNHLYPAEDKERADVAHRTEQEYEKVSWYSTKIKEVSLTLNLHLYYLHTSLSLVIRLVSWHAWTAFLMLE